MLTALKFTKNNERCIQVKLPDYPDAFCLKFDLQNEFFKGMDTKDLNGPVVFVNKIEDGVYETMTHSFEYIIRDHTDYQEIKGASYGLFDESWNLIPRGGPLFGYKTIQIPYGVADNIEQIKEFFAKAIQNPNQKLVISYVVIDKKDEPKNGGWRWHKWGEYIGKHEIQHEYLADEVGIEKVLCFHGHFIEKKEVI